MCRIRHLYCLAFFLLIGSSCSISKPLQEVDSYINIRDYGAVGDGVHDDYESIQKAINDGKGRTIFIPRGNYTISKSLIIPIGGIKIQGEGDVGGSAGSVISPMYQKTLKSIFSSDNHIIEDLILQNIRTIKAEYAIYLNTGENGYMTKVKIYNCVFQEHHSAIFVEGSVNVGMYANIIRDSYFKNCHTAIYCEGVYNINQVSSCGFENIGYSYVKLGRFGKSVLANSFNFNRCESVRNENNGFAFFLNSNTHGFYIDGNYFENSFLALVESNGASNVSFSKNVLMNIDNNPYVLSVNGGSFFINVNSALTGLILDVFEKGYVSQLIGNEFLNFSPNVKRKNLGRVDNSYNQKFDN